MRQLDRAAWSLTPDRHENTATLCRDRYNGQDEWSIHISAINQRDDDKKIDGLSTAQMLEIADIVKSLQP